MKKAAILMVGAAAMLTLAACESPPPPEVSPVATALPTAAAALTTPVARLGTAVAGAVATPVITPSATITPTRTSTPLPTPTPGTPTATPTPAPSAGLIMAAASLEEKLDALREAIATGDKDALLKAQRALLTEIPKAEIAAANDPSKAAEAFRGGLRDLRAALGGDLAKMDAAVKGIAAVTGTLARPQAGSATAVASTNVQPIANLSRYAKELADQIAAFRTAQDEGNVGDLLRVQKALLEQLDRGEAALKNARTKDGETVRGALEDLRNALGGDAVKFDAAQAKLQQVAGGTGTASAPAKTTATRQVDLQPVANELSNKLGDYEQAVDRGDKEAIAKAQKALADQVAQAQAAIKDEQSPRAIRLRDTLGAIREAAAGDQSKIAAAKAALEGVLASQ